MAHFELKQPIIDEVSQLLDGAQSVVLAQYRGITVEEDTKLRKELRESNVIYKVYKNTLVNLAVKGTDFEELAKDLKGPLAIAVSKEDATAPARILAKYCKDIEVLSIVSGIVEGTYYDAAGMNAISSIPSRDVLLSKLLGSLQSPIANFARVMQQLAEKGGASEVETAEAAPAEEKAEEVTEAPVEEAKAEEPAAEAEAQEEAPVEEAKTEEPTEEA